MDNNQTPPTNTSEAQRNAPPVNYAGRDTCPLCGLEFAPDRPHAVTIGVDCINALKAEIARRSNAK